MVDFSDVFFNVASFVGGLFVLEYGADTFIDYTAKVASRLGVSPTLIALITAGAEWEELVVVVAAISQNRSSLALGNVLGSSISNILGAFSLGLIFSPGDVKFDKSAKIYTSLLLALTSVFVVFLAFLRGLGRVGGACLVITFTVYMTSIAYFIYKGVVAPPVDDDDDDDDSDSDSDSDSDDEDENLSPARSSTSTLRDEEAALFELEGVVDKEIESKDTSGPVVNMKMKASQKSLKPYKPQKSLLHNMIHLILGFIALSLSGYILSHSISSVADAYSLSGNLVGITILSFATTLPEKLVAVFGASRNQSGIVVANTAGSNVFLITLCAGVLFLAGDLEVLTGHLSMYEVMAVWVSSALLWVIVMKGGKKWMGWALLGLYVGFIALEFIYFGGEIDL